MSPIPSKPTKHARWAYDYAECRDYLQARDGYDERDVAGHFAGHPEAPYQDFWHFVCAQVPGLSNPSEFVMDDSWAEDAEPWQQEILEKYLEVFGETDAQGNHCIPFSVSW